ncbi:MAG: NAD(P)-binding protein [Cyanobium sp.]
MIGAGVAGCALVAELRRSGFAATISLWESGRGPGGRTATRRSRQDPGLRFDHGAPLFNVTGRDLPPLVERLLTAGAIESWKPERAVLTVSGSLRQEDAADPFGQGALFRGRGGMEQLCQGLLGFAGEGVEPHYGAMVRDLATSEQGLWQLLDPQGALLASAHWLILASTLLAHPRSRLLLGWQHVPLARAARGLADPELGHALAALASIRSEARSNLLLLAEGEAAAAWLGCPFRLLRFDGAAEQRWRLSRLAIQPLEDGRVAVVAHSSAVFAAEHLSVYGSRSSIASQLDQRPPREQEEAVIAELSEAVAGALAPWLRPEAVTQAPRQLMRWGAAFPQRPGLPAELALCRRSRVGFCGDYVEGEGFGRVEGALRSGSQLAQALLKAMAAEDSGGSGCFGGGGSGDGGGTGGGGTGGSAAIGVTGSGDGQAPSNGGARRRDGLRGGTD